MGRITKRHKALRFDLGTGVARPRIDTIAVEEPLEVRLNGTALTVTMRTPGHDMELVHGLLLAEGVIRHRDDVVLARYCADTDTMNVVDVTLRDGVSTPVSAQRSLVAYGGCGLCGKSSIDAVLAVAPPRTPGAAQDHWSADLLAAGAEQVRAAQTVFDRTGGVHAAGLLGPDGPVRVVREDIGRHNAVDKVLGWSVLQDVSRTRDALVVTSRASFEIVQKAAMAGIGLLACVSAPSSLAVEAAEEFGMTLVAFLRSDRMTVFTGAERIVGGLRAARPAAG